MVFVLQKLYGFIETNLSIPYFEIDFAFKQNISKFIYSIYSKLKSPLSYILSALVFMCMFWPNYLDIYFVLKLLTYLFKNYSLITMLKFYMN